MDTNAALSRNGIDSDEMRAPTFFNNHHHHRRSSQSDSAQRDSNVVTPPQLLPPGSSPAAASVDSFSSYINKDAPLFQNRSSSPRAEDALQRLSDPPEHEHESPSLPLRPLDQTPKVTHGAFRTQQWADRPVNGGGVMSIEHLQQSDHAEQHSSYHHHHRQQHVPASPSPAIDVNRLSVSNLAQKNQEDVAAAGDASYQEAHMRAAASIIDDSFESTASVVGEDSKNEIRRRRRTRPDEANLLAEVYAKNPFPDHETRLFLANRVGMSVRAVSVWFQNRRQAEKKRSGRYGGSGIALTSNHPDGSMTPAQEEAPAKSEHPSAVVPPVFSQRKPFGNANAAAANASVPTKPLATAPPTDLSSNNKENIPPWLSSAVSQNAQVQRRLEKIKRDAAAAAPAIKKEVIAPRRDLRQAVGPQGVGIGAQRVEVVSAAAAVPAQTVEMGSSSSKTGGLSRHRSTPRLSLDDVLGGRAHSLRRATTEHAKPLVSTVTDTGASSQVADEEQLDTILPPPKLLSRASSSSSLSLLTTSGGRASIGALDPSKISGSPISAAPSATAGDFKASLTSALPAQLTAALQRQGIIACESPLAVNTVKRAGLLQMMPSSSASSSEADALFPHNAAGQSDGEDEERTLKLIAQRRAAKAQAAALAKAQAARQSSSSNHNKRDGPVMPMDPSCADARKAIVQQAGGSSADVSIVGKKSGVVGLGPARQLSLDWAAGRDRASTSALAGSIASTPLSRSVSAKQLRVGPMESTPLSSQQSSKMLGPNSVPTHGEKRKATSAGRRSLSATDLTRRLQEAKRKGDPRATIAAAAAAAPRKRASEVRDENVNPSDVAAGAIKAPAAKRRRAGAQLEEAVLGACVVEPPVVAAKMHAPFGSSGVSPMLGSRPFVPHASFPSAGSRGMPTMIVPSTPSNPASLYSSAPMSTRSDRFRAIGASPATSLGRSISANYPSHHRQMGARGMPSSAARSSSGTGQWDLVSASRPYSQQEESWTPRSARVTGAGGGESLSQPLQGSTPSRVLGDRTNFATPSTLGGGGFHGSSQDEAFMHDDSGFFGSLSEDEEHHAQVVRNSATTTAAVGKKAMSPRKASLRSMVGRGAEEGDDHQAAELLLGLGKTVGSRDSSSSQ